MRRRRATVGFVVLALLVTSCGDDEKDAGDIGSVDEWCATVQDVDHRFDAADSSSDEFAAKQQRYREISTLLHDLTASIGLVDADARDAVGETVGWAITLTDIVAAADSEAAAADELTRQGGVFAQGDALNEAGAAWILANCDVDING